FLGASTVGTAHFVTAVLLAIAALAAGGHALHATRTGRPVVVAAGLLAATLVAMSALRRDVTLGYLEAAANPAGAGAGGGGSEARGGDGGRGLGRGGDGDGAVAPGEGARGRLISRAGPPGSCSRGRARAPDRRRASAPPSPRRRPRRTSRPETPP